MIIKKILLPTIWVLALAGVFFLTGSFKKSTTQFFGITDQREQAVSFQEPVEITEVMVIEGQQVQRGSILLKARRSELGSQKTLLKHQFDELNARQRESKSTLNAEIKVLQAKQKSELSHIDAQIQQIQSRLKLNSELYANITGEVADMGNSYGPLREQIESLRLQRQYLAGSIQTQIDALFTRLTAAQKPLEIQKNQVSDELAEISRQTQELTIHADFSGRIGSINFKQGEQVPSFQGILTVHGSYPEYVKGFIHENVSNDVQINQQVWVHPIYSKTGQPVAGIVESLGSRIVEYPERLRKNSGIRSWGREANIRLESGNPLLLGEKVQISFSRLKPNSAEALLTPLGKFTESVWPDAFANKLENKPTQIGTR